MSFIIDVILIPMESPDSFRPFHTYQSFILVFISYSFGKKYFYVAPSNYLLLCRGYQCLAFCGFGFDNQGPKHVWTPPPPPPPPHQLYWACDYLSKLNCVSKIWAPEFHFSGAWFRLFWNVCVNPLFWIFCFVLSQHSAFPCYWLCDLIAKVIFFFLVND